MCHLACCKVVRTSILHEHVSPRKTRGAGYVNHTSAHASVRVPPWHDYRKKCERTARTATENHKNRCYRGWNTAVIHGIVSYRGKNAPFAPLDSSHTTSGRCAGLDAAAATSCGAAVERLQNEIYIYIYTNTWYATAVEQRVTRHRCIQLSGTNFKTQLHGDKR